MDKKIIAYGYGDKTKYGLPTEGDLTEYLREWIFTDNGRRHRYTQAKKADIIVVSRDGVAYGHMVIEDIVNPIQQDFKDYPKVKKVYIIKSTAVYKNPVKLKELGIHVSQFGKSINPEEFKKIKRQAGKIDYFPNKVKSKS